jgi:ATP-dependent DNA helicase RecQ
MGSGACVGGITFDGRSVRLIAPDRETNDQFNMEYSLGDVWDVDGTPDPETRPPHIENILVNGKRKHPPIDDLTTFITNKMDVRQGGVDQLFEGLAQATKAGVQYISERTGLPSFSTMFWRPDQALELVDDSKRIRYRYPTADGGRTITFVGFQEPLPYIPAGTLLRVSLAHWWRPDEMPEGELRCYVQLSGWYEESTVLASGYSYSPAPPIVFEDHDLTLDEAAAELKRIFGYDEFRPLQREVIANVLDKQDSLAIMPTGSGKSLCFQIPAVLFPGLTVVVTPLISLMQDQVDQLRDLGVSASYLNSTLSYDGYLQETAAIRAGQTKLLYAAPETLLRPETIHLLEQVQVDCLAIDEAHCISEWGHDFRPEYRQLVDLRQRLPGAVCVAMTATATERVREDIKRNLSIEDADEFVASFDRPNLSLTAVQRTSGFPQVMAFLNEHRGEAGIIYCNTKKDVDALAANLVRKGRPALPYHADLDDATRRAHQRRFVYEEGLIIVATIAFGMGINKSNVRFIVHYGLPKNLENYYQQIGRAGRDGLPADCLLLWSYKDTSTIRYFIDQEDPAQQPGANARLQAMMDFANTRRCRRIPLLSYFGEPYIAKSCAACDNCDSKHETNTADTVDLTIPAQKFLSCVKRTRELFGASYIIDVLRGSRAQKVLQNRHDQISTYGIGKEYSKTQWQQLADEFIHQGLLRRDQTFGSLQLTAAGEAVMKGQVVVQGQAPSGKPAQPRAHREAGDFDQVLFEALRAKRSQLAQEGNVPPYVVFSDLSLVEMASSLPQTEQAFASITGVGEVKLQKYAQHFLPIIRTYVDENRAVVELSERTQALVEVYNSGVSLEELAGEEQIKQSTVCKHLWDGAQAGLALRPEGFLEASRLDAPERERVLKAFAELGTAALRPVFDQLNGEVSYEELHLLRLYFTAVNTTGVASTAV